MATVCGNKHLRLPFRGKLINQPLHTDMAEMILRLLKQQRVDLSPPAADAAAAQNSVFDETPVFLFRGDEWKYRPQ